MEKEPVDKTNRPLNKLTIVGTEVNSNPIAEDEWEIEQEVKKHSTIIGSV